MPLAIWCGVALALTEPTDQAVEPPSLAFFSISTTLRPSARASSAAASPLPPPPTTTTSYASVPGSLTAFPARSAPRPGLGAGFNMVNCHLPIENTG